MTREGRRREFAHFAAFSTPEMRDKIPDPIHERTFQASKLDWTSIEHAPRSREFRNLSRDLLKVRHDRIVPLIKEGFADASAELLARTRAAPKDCMSSGSRSG